MLPARRPSICLSVCLSVRNVGGLWKSAYDRIGRCLRYLRTTLKVAVNLVAVAVLAIELLATCQAMEFLRPLTTTAPLEAVYKLVRTKIP